MEIGLIILLLVVIVILIVITLNNKRSIDNLLRNNENYSKSQEVLLTHRDISSKTQGLVEGVFRNVQNLQNQVNELKQSGAKNASRITDTYSVVDSLSKVMLNQKRRGNFGEFQLSNIMAVYCGDNQNIYSMQYQLKNGTIVDCALNCPGDERILAIDAKFPLENYNRIIDSDNEYDFIERYKTNFKNDVKKHINDIFIKYINIETQPYAVMFVPSEAIYQYIAGENPELIDYAHTKKVLIVSPTTLLGVVFTIINLTKDLNRAKHSKEIEKTVSSLKENVDRLVERHEKAIRNCNTLLKSLEDTSKSIDKIESKVVKVFDGYVDEIDD